MLVTVTREDIDASINAGCAGDCELCPIALAIKKLIPGERLRAQVQVCNEAVAIGRSELPLPLRAQAFVTNFDALKLDLAQPFVFNLPKLDVVIRVETERLKRLDARRRAAEPKPVES